MNNEDLKNEDFENEDIENEDIEDDDVDVEDEDFEDDETEDDEFEDDETDDDEFEDDESEDDGTEDDGIEKKSPGGVGRHAGYVALIGRTNAGKSTFLNQVMETKVSIVSNKPQTTRRQILGIKTTERGQIIFFDSPGIHKPYFKLNEKMMKEVYASLLDADIILYFMEMDDHREDEFALSLFQNAKKPVFLLINKIDKYNKAKVLDKINTFKDSYEWAEIVPMSALKGLNTDVVEDLIYKYLPENDNFYPDEEFTLQSERFYVSEMIREKILHNTRQELPFTTMVKVEEITEKEKVFYVRADIYVESRSQKKILVGKHGNFVKLVGEESRKDLEDYFDKQVYLELFIKIVPNWRNSAHVLSNSD